MPQNITCIIISMVCILFTTHDKVYFLYYWCIQNKTISGPPIFPVFTAQLGQATKRSIVKPHCPWSVNHKSWNMYSFIIFSQRADSFLNTFMYNTPPLVLVLYPRRWFKHTYRSRDISNATKWKWFPRFFKCLPIKTLPALNRIINICRTLDNVDR